MNNISSGRMRVLLAALILCLLTIPADAHPRHHHHQLNPMVEGLGIGLIYMLRSIEPRPRAWCGWEMRRLVGADPGPTFNLARNWAHWGNPAPGPQIGVVVVWRHHVGRIVGQENGQWIIESGNDGHQVRTRPLSLAHAIAFRW
jgi:hypothetical protein